MLKVWNIVLVTGVLARDLRHVPHALGRRQLDPLVHAELDRRVVPRLHRARRRGSVALIFSRLPLLRAKTRLESLVSREATFLYNNLLLVALCLTILWGVVFPILSEAVLGERADVGRPYYNFFLRAFGLPLLLLMGIGPLIAWRRASAALARAHVPLAGAASPAGDRPARARRRLVAPRADRLHVLGLRARDDRLRVRARHAGAAALSGGSWLGASTRSSPATGAATAATSSTPRSCCSRSASPARARTTRPRRTLAARRVDGTSATTAHLPLARPRGGRPNATEIVRRLDVERGGERSARSRPARTPTRRGAGLERGRHPQRPADRRGPVRDRRADRPRRHRALPGASSSRS